MSEDGEGRREVLACQNERRPSLEKLPMSHRVRGRCLVAGGWQLRLIGSSAENRYNTAPDYIISHFRQPTDCMEKLILSNHIINLKHRQENTDNHPTYDHTKENDKNRLDQ